MFKSIKDKFKNFLSKSADVVEEKQEISKTEKTVEKKVSKTQNENKSKEEEKGIFTKLKENFVKKKISQNEFDKIFDELQIFLLEINVSFEIVEKIKLNLEKAIFDKSFDRFSINKEIKKVLEETIFEVLKGKEKDFLQTLFEIKKNDKDNLIKIMILGVNGTGKTTTIAKIINFLKKNNLKSVVAACDTFRAAAIEQLETHCKNLNIKIIKQKIGSDPSAVAFDSIEHAKAKNLDVVLIDTAGRMPNKQNLMSELEKIKRVSKSNLNLFIGDSITGVDLINQIKLFDEIVGLDGCILTKVDTDQRPGSIITTSYQTNVPIFFLGTGQNYEDLIEFRAKEISKKFFEEN